MVDELEQEPISDPSIPGIKFTPEEMERIRQSVGVVDTPSPESIERDSTSTISRPRRRRGRGRPRALNPDGSFKYPRAEDSESGPEEATASASPSPSFSPAPLTKRDEKEVASRLVQILTGTTGIAANIKPYLQMTDDEARDIANPLSSYLVRNADTLPVARQVLENYDLLAIFIGVMVYVVRVYRDRSIELQRERSSQSGFATTTIDRIRESQEQTTQRQSNGGNGFVSTPSIPDVGY